MMHVFFFFIARRQRPNRPRISQPHIWINRQKLPCLPYPVNHTAPEEEVLFAKQPRNSAQIVEIRVPIALELCLVAAVRE